MTFENIFEEHKNKFLSYSNFFNSGDPLYTHHINQKITHTMRVTDIARYIAESEELDARGILIAQLAALYHDVGRFIQYHKYNTYDDSRSENHAELSVKTIVEQNFLSDLSDEETTTILNTIQNHNLIKLPQIADIDILFYSGLLRDADKVDIIHLMADICSGRNEIPYGIKTEGIPKEGHLSQGAIRELEAGLLVTSKNVKIFDDYKLLMLGWVYDINFTPTYRALLENNYLNEIMYSIEDYNKHKELLTSIISIAEKEVNKEPEKIELI